MKRVLFFIMCMLLILLASCENNDSKRRESILMNQINELRAENIYLKGQLDDLKKEKQSKQNNDPSNIQKIGRWLDNHPGADTQLFLNKDLDSNKYYLIHKYSDGSTSKDEVQVTKEKGLVRFQEINTNHIEWYIIEKNGDLSMYSQSGKFATALCF